MPDDRASGEDLIRTYVRAKGQEREEALIKIQGALPSWIRVYDVNELLRVYFDDAQTPLPPWLTLAANYIERVFSDGSAEVEKGGFGAKKLPRTTEPRPKTSWERLLIDDLV